MSKAVIVPEELLERATALAKSERNIEIMDRTAILHGYLELTRLDPNNTTYRKNVEDAAASLLQAADDEEENSHSPNVESAAYFAGPNSSCAT